MKRLSLPHFQLFILASLLIVAGAAGGIRGRKNSKLMLF